MMGDADRDVVELRDRAPKNYQAALLVLVFIVGLLLGLIDGLSMAPEEHTPYYLPKEDQNGSE
jgi:hypothetical protein